MLVEFSIVPLGQGTSVSRQVAGVIAIVEQSGLPYKLNPMGTVVEGAWEAVIPLIKACHDAVMAEGERVITTIKIDDRKDRTNMLEQKIASVEKRLGHKPRL